jgi:hypothetical protein
MLISIIFIIFITIQSPWSRIDIMNVIYLTKSIPVMKEGKIILSLLISYLQIRG